MSTDTLAILPECSVLQSRVVVEVELGKRSTMKIEVLQADGVKREGSADKEVARSLLVLDLTVGRAPVDGVFVSEAMVAVALDTRPAVEALHWFRRTIGNVEKKLFDDGAPETRCAHDDVPRERKKQMFTFSVMMKMCTCNAGADVTVGDFFLPLGFHFCTCSSEQTEEKKKAWVTSQDQDVHM